MNTEHKKGFRLCSRSTVKFYIKILSLVLWFFILAILSYNKLHQKNQIKPQENNSQDLAYELIIEIPKNDNLLVDLENSRKLDLNLTKKQLEEAKELSKVFNQYLENSRLYLNYVVQKLEENNLPLELAVIPMIESNYKPDQKSSAGAKGHWQFVKVTGKEYGLKETKTYDDFKDFEKSTESAIKLFTHLYDVFKSWDKAIVAYNIGEFALKKDSKRINSQYLKKFKVFAEILMNPSQYNINIEIKNRDAFVRVPASVLKASNLKTFEHVSAHLNIDIEKLKELNSGYKTNIIDHHGLLLPTNEFLHLFAKN